MEGQKEYFKYNPSGKIKTRIFALILLALSCSLAISAFKSLGRSFDGIVIRKAKGSGFIKNSYVLHIDQNGVVFAQRDRVDSDVIKSILENYDDCVKIGVSDIVFSQAEPLMSISKKRGSPIIVMNETYFLDQGLSWLLLSLLGLITAVVIHGQTAKKLPSADNNRSEDLDL